MTRSYTRRVSADRDELRRLVDDLPDDEVPSALAQFRARLVRSSARAWPPVWFGAADGRTTDTPARVDEILAEGFARRG